MQVLERRGTLWFVAALTALLCAIANLPWTLDDYEQAKQAYTSFEMVNEGHWFHQHTPNEKIANKPPLVGWVSAGIYGLTRSWELAWRLPSLAAAAALGWLLWRAARQAYGASAGLLALSAFGLNLLALRLATLVRTDMPLALFLFLLGLQIWRKIRDAEPWTRRDRVVAFALLTAAILTKGPILYAFLLPAIAAYEWRRRVTGNGASAWSGWRPWLAALAVFLIWVEAGVAFVPNFYEEAVLKEFLGRFGETVHRPQPFYFYLPHLLHKFAPWSVLLVAFAVLVWRLEKAPLVERLKRTSPEKFWLICWCVGGLLIMSAVPSKRVDRIFPIVPPLCLLMASLFNDLSRTTVLGRRAQRWALAALVAAVLISSGYVGQRVFISYRNDEAALARFGAAVRRETTARGWRYGVVGTLEEGLLLYLRRMHFTPPEEAIALWKAGELDAVVIPEGKLSRVSRSDFPGAVPTGLQAAITINREPRPYLLLQRVP
jgi:4-amino-4-deoxy-L-arabinose transferase